MLHPLVSIIIPTYNSELHLQECLESVYEQNYPRVELIIIDGNSNDRTLKILEKNSDLIDKLVSEKDTGIYNAINKGIAISNGELVKILNSDDTLKSGVIEKAVTKYQYFKDRGFEDILIIGYLERTNSQGITIGIWGKLSRSGLFENILHPSWFLSKSVYDKHGLYNEHYKIASDYDYYMRILNSSQIKVYKIREVLVRFREGGASANFSGKKEVIQITRQYKGYLSSILIRIQMDLIKLINRFRK